jgi:predicted amidohydrolase
MSTLPLPLALRVPQAGGPHVNGACFGADGDPDRQMHGCSAVWAEAERKERLAEAAAQAIAQSAVFAATLALRRLRGGTRRGTRLGTRRGAQRAASAAVA